MICKDGLLVGLIDFEEVCYDDILFDVAISIIGCCYCDGKLNKNFMKALLHAYNSENPFTELEKSIFGDYMIYSCVCLSFWRFRQFCFVQPNHQLKDSYKEISNHISDWIRHPTMSSFIK